MNLDSLAQELDRLYEFEISEYIARCDELKSSGYKIFRNSAGLHKVVATNPDVRSRQEQIVNDNVETRNENFLVRAYRSVKRGIHYFRSFVGFIKYLYRYYKKRDM